MSSENASDLRSPWFDEPGQITEHAVEVLGLLSFDEFQEVQRLIGLPRERHKDWASQYIWPLKEGQDPGPVLAYLKTLSVHYKYKQILHWRGVGEKCQPAQEE
jgi:hypothetical protein